MGRLRRNAGTLAAAAFWLLVWEAASLAVGSPLLLAGPAATIARLLGLAATRTFWTVVAGSFCRIAAGFLAAYALALLLGWAASRARWFRQLMAPAFAALKSVPLVCIIVLLLLWVGARGVSALSVFLVVLPAIYFATLEGLDARDGRLEELLGAMGVPRARIALADGWQQLLPFLVATSRNVCGMAWKAGVAAELIGLPRHTIGEAIFQAKLLLETGDLFAWTIAVVAAAWISERVFLWCLRATGPLSLRLALEVGTRRLAEAADEPGAIVFSDAAVGYREGADERIVASHLDIALPAGSRWVLEDASGAGKTTFIGTAAGLLQPLAGEIVRPRALSLMCQDVRLAEALTAEGNVSLATGIGEAKAHELLRELLPDDALGRPVQELSGGQRRRVELVRALAKPGGAILLDEPFASLDEGTHERARAFVARACAGRTLVVATHSAADREVLEADPLECLG